MWNQECKALDDRETKSIAVFCSTETLISIASASTAQAKKEQRSGYASAKGKGKERVNGEWLGSVFGPTR